MDETNLESPEGDRRRGCRGAADHCVCEHAQRGWECVIAAPHLDVSDELAAPIFDATRVFATIPDVGHGRSCFAVLDAWNRGVCHL